MNVRKNIDYGQVYQAIDKVMAQNLPQVQLYSEIGKIVCSRREKGAAVMVSEYIRATCPDVQGFSPRNLRRMRDFYRTYENHPVLLSLAMQLGWTQNVVIMEADLTMEFREWYLRAAKQFGWSKAELTTKIAEQAHLEIVMDIEEEVCDNRRNEEEPACRSIRNAVRHFARQLVQLVLLQRSQGRPKRGEYHGPLCVCRYPRRSGPFLCDVREDPVL